MKRVAVLACSALLAGSATVLIAPGGSAAAASSEVIDVLAVANASSAASAVSIVPQAANATSATAGSPVAVPTTSSGANLPLTLTSAAEGQLALSGDGRYLTFAGYDATVGTAGPVASTTIPRVVGRMDASGGMNTSTLLGPDAYSGNNVRSAVTNDGTRFWTTGANGNAKTAAGSVLTAALGAGTATSVSTTQSAGRAVGIAGGNLYLSTDKTTPSKGVSQIGSGLPITAGQTPTFLAGSASSDPYGFALATLGSGTAPDTLYLADGTAGGITKFSLSGGTWASSGTVGSSTKLFGLAAKVESDGVHIYATSADGTKLYSVLDTSGRGGTFSGSLATIGTAPSNTLYRGVAFGPAGQPLPGATPSILTSDSVLGGVVGDAGNPTLTAKLSDPDSTVDPASLTLTAKSSDQTIAADSGITVTGSGATRTVSVTPAGAVGYATITLTATDSLGRSGSTTVQYGASAAASDSTSRWLDQASDSSSTVDVGNGYIVVADDSSNVIRLYHSDRSGPPVNSWDFGTLFGLTTKGSDSMDLEAAARVGDTIYWEGSMTNSSTDPYPARPQRSTLFATTVAGTGANTQLTLAGTRYTGLRQDLLAWDAGRNNALGFAASAAGDSNTGHNPKTIDGFNVEGMEFAADGRTAYLGFRAPLENTTDRTKALVVPVTNLPDLTSGAASTATFGTPLLWDLGGLAIREIRRNAHNQYLIIAGSYAGSDPTYRLYTWNGDPSSAPVAATTAVPAPLGGWESIVATPDPITSGAAVQLVEDDGSVDFYHDGQESKDLPLGLRKSRIDTFTLTLPAQLLAFTSAPPTTPAYGDTYVASATGGPSGQPVTLTVSGGGCTLGATTPGTDSNGNATASATVTYSDLGSCVVTAKQAGGTSYQAAAPVSQTSAAGKASPTITWPTPDHITYGTQLGAAQLDATTTVAGTFVYDPPAGTVLGAGQNTLSVTFTPTDTAHYSTSTATVTLTVDKAAQKIDFPALADRTFGNGPVTLQATGGASSAPVTYAASGQCTLGAATVTITGAGSCTVTASQAGDPNFTAAADVTRSFGIAKATPAIAWAAPASITYGTVLGATQLAAAASLNSTAVDGHYAYTLDDGTADASGATPTAGTHTLHVAFTPSDTDDYTSATASVPLTVTKATLSLTWTPSTTSLTYGDALTGDELDATASVPGSFVYDHPVGTVLHASSGTVVTATFSPTDTADYTGGAVAATFTVARAAQTLTIADPGTHRYGDAPFTVTATGGHSGSPVTLTAAGPCTVGTTTSSGDPVAGTATVTLTGAGDCRITAHQDGSADYLAAQDVSTSVTVDKATPKITWPAPDPITYGTAIGSTQLDATASVPGTFAYTLDDGTTAAGTTPTAGAHTLHVTFTPSDTADYDAATAAVTLSVARATPTVTWAAPASVGYGTAVGSDQLDATASVPGRFAYTLDDGTADAAGAKPAAGTHTLRVTFTPTDAADFTGATASVTLTVTRATPAITWTPDAALTYGDTLGSAQLDATASVPGTFAYTLDDGTADATGAEPAAGTHTLHATFTPADAADYTSAAADATISVAKAAQTLTLADPGLRRYGDAPVTVSATGGHSGSPVTFATTGPCTVGNAASSGDPVVGTATLTITGAGDCELTAHQSGSANYLAAPDVTRSVTVAKATPTLTWPAPTAITYGAAIGDAQLDATASVPGTFAYTLDGGTSGPRGAKPAAGDHTLSVTFTPTDTADYTGATASVTLTVTKAHASLAWHPATVALTYGDALGADQLDAVADATGSFTYDPPAGTVPDAGQRTLTATFVPRDAADYASGDTITTTVTVARAAQTLTVADPGTHRTGDAPFTVRATGGGSGSPVSFTVAGPCTVDSPASSGNPVTGTARVTITGAGDCRITAHQAGSANYLPAQDVTQSVTVAKATPLLTWPTPAAITYGTTLGAEQFDATASVAGTFAYTVDGAAYSGAVPGAGMHTLGVTFTPSDTADYDPATASVTLTVRQAASTVTLGALANRVVGAAPFAVPVTSSGSSAAVVVAASPASVCRVAGRTLTVVGVGTCTVSATLAGDANHAAAPPASTTFAVVYATRTAVLPSPPVRAGVPLTTYVQLVDAKGGTVSAASIPLRVLGVDAAASAKPGAGFRYQAATRTYTYALSTTGLRPGAHTLAYLAGADPTRHTIAFTIR